MITLLNWIALVGAALAIGISFLMTFDFFRKTRKLGALSYPPARLPAALILPCKGLERRRCHSRARQRG